MSRPRKDSLRVLTEVEVTMLEQTARARSEPASQVARAKAHLAVCAGHTYRDATRAAGRKSNDAGSHLVVRFNREGLAANGLRYGGGPPTRHGVAEWGRILPEALRTPDRQQDGTPPAAALALGTRWSSRRQHQYPLARPARDRAVLAAEPHVVRHREGQTQTQERRGRRDRPGRRG